MYEKNGAITAGTTTAINVLVVPNPPVRDAVRKIETTIEVALRAAVSRNTPNCLRSL
jgi:hypothetical protein